jgi:WhiB family redox-sensing transcriptional regulator
VKVKYPDVSKANCAGTDAESFFPDISTNARLDFAVVRKVCHRCEVMDECLEWALHHEGDYGIWGGTTGSERRRIRQERGISRSVGSVDTWLSMRDGAA